MNVLLVTKVYRAKNGKIRCKGGYSNESPRCVDLNKITYCCVDKSNTKLKAFNEAILNITNNNIKSITL